MLAFTLIFTLLRSADPCWTFDARPACDQDIDTWTCCDAVACFTFESEPVCELIGEAFVCCG